MATWVALVLGATSCGQGRGKSPMPTRQDGDVMIRLLRQSKEVTAGLRDQRSWIREKGSDDPLNADERGALLPLWATFVDHDLAFQSFKERFLYGWQRTEGDRGPLLALAMGMAAHVAQVRARLNLFQVVASTDSVRTAVNEESPEYGVAPGHLDRMAMDTATPQTLLLLHIGRSILQRRSSELDDATGERAERFRTLIERILEAADETDELYDKMGSSIIREVVDSVVSSEVSGVVDPLVLDIALWLGDVQVRGAGTSLISGEQLDALLPVDPAVEDPEGQLRPGDIIVERRNWYLSNLGLPGFWPHAALYIGSPEELRAHFDASPSTAGFADFLQATYPEQWAVYVEDHGDGPMRVIESISDGVVFASLHHSCLADYVAFMRPVRTHEERAWAIAQAMSHYGKPYDFDFDFTTKSTLVCSELVYYSYDFASEVSVGDRTISGLRSLDLELASVMGRTTLPPNDMVAQFDAEYDDPDRQLGFVAFLDGNAHDGVAYLQDVDTFRQSYRRPKWDLSQE